MFKAIITIMPKASVLDPQGEAVTQTLQANGFDHIHKVHVGKVIEVEMSEKNEAQLEKACQDLLSNPLIETYNIVWQ